MFFILANIPRFRKLIPSASFVETARISGLSFLRCALAAIKTGVSVIPPHNFAIVFPVQGAMTIASRFPFGPIGSAACMERMPICPVISSICSVNTSAFPKRLSMVCTFSEKIGMMSIPSSTMSCMISFIFSWVQKEPVIAKPILQLFSVSICSSYLHCSVIYSCKIFADVFGAYFPGSPGQSFARIPWH